MMQAFHAILLAFLTAEVAFYATVLHLETGLSWAVGPCSVVFNAP